MEIRRRIAYFRTRKRTYVAKEMLGASVVLVPFAAGLALHFIAGVRPLALLVIGLLAGVVGCIFFITKEDEFLVGLWLGASLLLALLATALLEGHSFSL